MVVEVDSVGTAALDRTLELPRPRRVRVGKSRLERRVQSRGSVSRRGQGVRMFGLVGGAYVNLENYLGVVSAETGSAGN